VKLSLHLHVGDNELELEFACFREHLLHHVVELVRVHRFKNLVGHVARRLPQTRRNVHLAEAVPVEAQALHVEVLDNLICTGL